MPAEHANGLAAVGKKALVLLTELRWRGNGATLVGIGALVVGEGMAVTGEPSPGCGGTDRGGGS